MKIWLITDTHFNHKDKMKQYCNRPDNYEDLIWDGFDCIGYDDLLIHLGDICIGEDKVTHNILSKYKFKKVLVKGNHDKKSNNWYLENGWDFVCDNFSLKAYGKNILFSHTPQPIGDYDINIHGHFHNKDLSNLDKEIEDRDKEMIKLITTNHKILSIEKTNYEPILLEHFLNKP